MRSSLLTLGAALLLLSACDEDGVFVVDPDLDAPTDFTAEYRWLLEGWSGTQPVGDASVQLSWYVPRDWNGEPFRVYSRRSGGGNYLATATVTSCVAERCVYSDVNVSPGRSYDYYVVPVDERSGVEGEPSEALRVAVPGSGRPAAPAAPLAVSLDDAVFLDWQATGAQRYLVFVESQGRDPDDLFSIGETDGSGFLDLRAVNGTRYHYSVAAVDTLGHVSDRSALATANPRPDAHGELVYAFADLAAQSGFRFPQSGRTGVVSGSAADAHWRLESVGGTLSLVPLNGSAVTPGTLTSALTCGPGSDPECVSVNRAPATGYQTTPVPLDAEYTYVLRVRGSDGRTRHAKVRVQLLGSDQQGRRLMIFDWAYQLTPDEPSLNVGR